MGRRLGRDDVGVIYIGSGGFLFSIYGTALFLCVLGWGLSVS